LPTTKGRLCVVVENLSGSCGYPLSQTHPITTTLTDPDGIGGVPPVIYGVARDGITAVLFTVSGRPVNVPVRDNFFAYEGRPFETVFSFSAVTALEGGE